MNSDEPIWKSGTSYIMLVIYYLLFGGFLILAVNNSEFPVSIFDAPYIPLDNWVVLLFILLAAILLSSLILKLLAPKYFLYDDRLVIQRKYAADLSLPNSDLLKWEYQVIKNRRSIYSDYIALHYREETVRLDDNLVSDLSDLAKQLRDKYPDLAITPKYPNTIINLFVNLFYILGVIGICISLYYWLEHAGDEVKGLTLKHTVIKLSEDPLFIEHTHKRDSSTYTMVLKSDTAKGFDFIFNAGKSPNMEKYKRNLHIADTVPIDILQYDYDVKVAKTREPNFHTKHIGWRQIEVSLFWYIDHTDSTR